MRNKLNIRALLRDNSVTVTFVLLCAICMVFSGQTLSYLMYELFGRLTRNAFIVLALIIPIVAGMGINFALPIGAMAAQISILWVMEWQVRGIGGFSLAALMTLPIGAVFGYLIGKMLNQMKGQEMIGSMILSFFANGLYQLLFLFIFGNLIPLNTPGLVIKGSTGVANTMDLSRGGLSYALDGLVRIPFAQAVYIVAALVVVAALVMFLRKKTKVDTFALCVGFSVLACVLVQLSFVREWFSLVQVPMVTFAVIALLCLFNVIIMRTRLGQQFRAVGQNGTVANASGIDVNRVRVIAIVISTVLAGWGQLIFVQNMGALQTYGAHEQVGLYAGAAVLVGGASLMRATNSQAILGCILFHMLFITSPLAAKNMFGNPAIGEYFRVFISYGVIALALVMHGWRKVESKKPANAILEAGDNAARAGNGEA